MQTQEQAVKPNSLHLGGKAVTERQHLKPSEQQRCGDWLLGTSVEWPLVA